MCYCPICWRYTLKCQAEGKTPQIDPREGQANLDNIYTGIYAAYAKSANQSPVGRKKKSKAFNQNLEEESSSDNEKNEKFKSPQIRKKGPPGLSP